MRKMLALALALGSFPAASGSAAQASSTLTLDGIHVEDGMVRADGTIRIGGWWHEDGTWPGPPDDVAGVLRSTLRGHLIFADADEQIALLLYLPQSDVWVPRPPVAYSWPITIDGVDDGRWLGAGNAGTGTPPSASWYGWGGVCTSTLDCEPVDGGIVHDRGLVGWNLSYEELGAGPGSTIEVGSANAGAATSFAWPVTPMADGTGALSTWDRVPGFKLPGEVRLGIAPAGTPPGEVEYAVTASVGPHQPSKPRAWSAELPVPALPGTYTLHSQTCWGLLDDLDCEHASADVTI